MSWRIRIVIWVLAVSLIVVGAAFLWWSSRDEGPEAVDLETAVAQVVATQVRDTVAAPAEGSGTAVEETVLGSDTSLDSVGGAIDADVEGPAVSETTMATRDDDPAAGDGEEVPSSASSDGGVAVSAVSETTEAVGDDDPAVDVGEELTPANPVAASLLGKWAVVPTEATDPLIRDPAFSFAGYRVVEELVGGLGESVVVGRTTDVTGSIKLTETALVAASVEVEMTTVRTDDSHRDSHMRKSLETKEFPLAVFTLVEPVVLPSGTFEGETFTGKALGDLTVKGVTRPAVFDLQATLIDETIVAVGTSEIVFSDYGVSVPTSANVISVEDRGVIEFQLYFTADQAGREVQHPAEDR